MFCLNCGANLPEDTSFCPNCGTAAAKPQPAPAEQAPEQPTPAPLSRGQFLSKAAGPKTKRSATVVLITGLVSIALILASIFSVFNTSLFELPMISLVIDLADVDTREVTDSLKEVYDTMEEDFGSVEDEIEEDIGVSGRKDVEKLIDSVGALSENFSLQNFNNLLSDLEAVSDELEEAGDLIDTEEITEVLDGLKIVSSVANIVVWAAFALPLLFALLACLLKKTGLTVTAMILTLLSQLLLCSLVLTGLTLAVYIVQIVLCTKLSAAYRQYQLTGAAA